MLPIPSVSIVVPVYNAQRYLPAAMKSVLAQALADWELIAVNDGSTDRSLRILKWFAAKDARIRVVDCENRGIEKSLNEGIALARGQFIARMDADDIVMPNRLGLQLKFMQEHPEVVVLGGSYLLIDDQGRELTVRTPPIDDDALQRQLLAGQNPICHSLVMMRRDAVQKAGGYLYDLPAAEDLDLWLRLGEMGRIACLPEVLLKYRLHSGTISESKQELQLRNMRQACERAWKRRGIHGEFQGQLWRPLDTRQSRHEFALRYGWWAFNGGHARTAFAYGLKAVALKPYEQNGWKLMACAAIKRGRPQRQSA